MNTNNGYTIFEDGTKIECRNRVVIFDSQLRHAGVPTDEKKVVINFNFTLG